LANVSALLREALRVVGSLYHRGFACPDVTATLDVPGRFGRIDCETLKKSSAEFCILGVDSIRILHYIT
jgi:hypothetical protein